MKIKAAVLFEINQPLSITDLEIPDLKPGQVFVDVVYSGICHSQLNEIRGLKGDDKFLPHTLGHEGSGIVLDVGRGVTKVKPGDHVVLTWIKGDGYDIPSTVYKSSNGPINSGAISTFMQKTVISENRLVSISKDMPLKEAALLGCAIITGAGIVLNDAKVTSVDSVAVFGVGGIGLSAVIAASLIGVSKLVAIDILDHKLKLAQHFGATHIINAKDKDPLDEIMNITDGKGVDYAIESAGSNDSMEMAFKSVSIKGGRCIISGNLPTGDEISISPMDLIKGKNISGTWGGDSQPDKDIPKYVERFLDNRLNLDGLITHMYKLEDINKAFEDLDKGQVGRALIDMQPIA